MFLISVLISGLKAQYESRFRWEYYPDELAKFMELRKEGPSLSVGPEIPMATIIHMLDLLSFVLPYKVDPGMDDADRGRLMEAISIKKRLMLQLWDNEDSFLILNVCESVSQHFANVLLHNMLGNLEELDAPLPIGIPSVEHREPFMDIYLKELYSHVIMVYEITVMGTPLYRILHDRMYLAKLSRLLHSPDKRERGMILKILGMIVKRDIPSFARLNEDKRDIVRETFSTIVGVLQSGFFDMQTCESEVALRPAAELLAMLNGMMSITIGTEFEITIQATFLKGALPLLNLEGYSTISGYVDIILKEQLRTASKKQKPFWEMTCMFIVKNLFRTKGNYDDGSDHDYVHSITNLFTKGLIAPSSQGSLIKKLVRHVYKKSRWDVQLSFLHATNRSKFTNIFSASSPNYKSKTLRLRILRTFLLGIYNWYLREPRNEDVRKELRAVTAYWMNSRPHLELIDIDFDYGIQARAVWDVLNSRDASLSGSMARLTIDKDHVPPIPAMARTTPDEDHVPLIPI